MIQENHSPLVSLSLQTCKFFIVHKICVLNLFDVSSVKVIQELWLCHGWHLDFHFGHLLIGIFQGFFVEFFFFVFFFALWFFSLNNSCKDLLILQTYEFVICLIVETKEKCVSMDLRLKRNGARSRCFSVCVRKIALCIIQEDSASQQKTLQL